MNEQTHLNKQNFPDTNAESLMDMLASKDILTRQKARESLATLGNPAVPSLIRVLQNSKLDHLRWEAAKTLGSFQDTRAIPPLVKALEDKDRDVGWLAAVALKKFKKAAWPQLLNALIKSKPDALLLRQGVHHVLRNQKEDGFNDLLVILMKTLESSSAPESTAIAAYNLLRQMKVKS